MSPSTPHIPSLHSGTSATALLPGDAGTEEEASITAPIVSLHNTILLDLTLAIKGKSIPWEGYQRALLITAEELAQIRAFEQDKASAEYFSLFTTLLRLTRVDTLQGILVTGN